jgi:8-oxo-dGTP diphosphatase
MHKTKSKIIRYLQYHPRARFNELKQQSVNSNKLSYHVNGLDKEGLIENNEGKYSLTLEGKRLLNFLSKENSPGRRQPVSVVAMLVKNKGRFLFQKRQKDPWFGYWLLIGGKVEFGDSLTESCAKELYEETGLKGKLRFFGMVSSRSYNQGKLAYHVHLFCYNVTGISGRLKIRLKEGKNQWLSPKDIEKLKIHPLDYLIYSKRKEKNWLAEQDEFYEGDKLLSSKIRKFT